jgi:hypothetical protein
MLFCGMLPASCWTRPTFIYGSSLFAVCADTARLHHTTQLRHCGDKTCAPLNRPGTTVCKGTSIRVFHECEMQKQFSL